MSRTKLSIAGGIILPLSWYVFSVFLSFLIYTFVGWERLPSIAEKLLFLPVGWTEDLYESLFTPHMFETFTISFLLLSIVGNFIFYSLLTYAVLYYFEKRSLFWFK